MSMFTEGFPHFDGMLVVQIIIGSDEGHQAGWCEMVDSISHKEEIIIHSLGIEFAEFNMT